MQRHAQKKNAEQGQRGGGARRHGGHRPPRQHRHLRAQQVRRHLAQRGRLRLDAGEALDHRDIAQRVGGAFGEVRVIALDLALQPVGAAQDENRQHAEQQHHQDQQGRQPPVDEQRQRQQNEQGDEGRAVLAKEIQPDARHARRAVEHVLQQATGMDARVIAERQVQHVLEIFRHDGEAPAVRQPVGVQGDQHGRHDGEQAKADPGAQQRREFRPLRRAILGLRRRQLVDDPAKQDRLGELGARQSEIGRHEDHGERRFRAEQAQNAEINTEKLHGLAIGDAARGRGPPNRAVRV